MVYQKPETALKRVEELEAVGQNSQAYALLLDIIVSKRTRQTPMAVVEPIMKRFVELSVKLRKAKTFKEGLNQYKNICLQAGQIEATSTAVFEFLIKSLGILNKYEPGNNDEQFTIDKQFIWEAYRIGVDSLRNHAELDFAYHKVAVEAINFLKEYNMRSEFKRLAEALRLHLSYTIKGSSQPSPVNLADPFTLQRHLDTRFYISQAAKDMKLWNECFRAVEDIHCLLELSSTNPDQKSILKYFEVLQQVWLFGDDYLFHAAAYQKYFNGLMEQGALDSSEKIGQMATTMLISALAAPTAQSNDDKWRAQRNVRFMLYDSVPPCRAELLDYAVL